MRFRSLVVLVCLNGCVCFQPVDEFPDGGSPIVVEQPVTSFIAPVPLEDLAERDFFSWQRPPVADTPLGSTPWRSISFASDGRLLVDAVGGFILPDGGYTSVANESWRQNSRSTGNSWPQWSAWNGSWYRYTYWDGAPEQGNDVGPLNLWRLSPQTSELEIVATMSSPYDAGYLDAKRVSAVAIWRGAHLLIRDSVWAYSRREYVEGRLLFAATEAELASPRVIDELENPMLADGEDEDTLLLWTGYALENSLLSFRGTEVTQTAIDAGYCRAPQHQANAPLTVGCRSDGGLDVWTADRNGAHLVGYNPTPPETRAIENKGFLASINPYRFVFIKETDAGTVLTICNSEQCVEQYEVFSTPPNAAVDDAGALYVADYILDAGVRVTRFAPGHW